MPESTLSLTIDHLKAEIGHFLGYGRGTEFSEPAWDTIQTNDIASALQSCLSQVYDPQPLPGESAAHSWSFLKPWATLALSDGSATAPLPADFGGFEGPSLHLTGDTANRYWPVPITNEGIVERYHALHSQTTGPPQIACERQLKATAPDRSTRSEVFVWPTPDQDYEVRVSYTYRPDVLTGQFPYPPGGSAHAELFKASAIAAAEFLKDNMQGPAYAYFVQRLAASVSADRKRKGHVLGLNLDRSDGPGLPHEARDYARRFGWGNPVTVNGVVPD